jgi:hypothetical protein
MIQFPPKLYLPKRPTASRESMCSSVRCFVRSNHHKCCGYLNWFIFLCVVQEWKKWEMMENCHGWDTLLSRVDYCYPSQVSSDIRHHGLALGYRFMRFLGGMTRNFSQGTSSLELWGDVYRGFYSCILFSLRNCQWNSTESGDIGRMALGASRPCPL